MLNGIPERSYVSHPHVPQAMQDLFRIESFEPIAEQAEQASSPEERAHLEAEYKRRSGVESATRHAHREVRLRIVENVRLQMEMLLRRRLPVPMSIETLEANAYDRRTPFRNRPSTSVYQAALDMVQGMPEMQKQPEVSHAIAMLYVLDSYEPLALSFERDILTPEAMSALAQEYKEHCGVFPKDRHKEELLHLGTIQSWAELLLEQKNQSDGNGESDGASFPWEGPSLN